MDKVELCIIAGTGSYEVKPEDFGRLIRRMQLNTPFGKTSPIWILQIKDEIVGIIHRHGESKFEVAAPFINYRANIYAAKELGAERIVSWNAVGAINPRLRPGDFVVPHNLIDWTKRRSYTFFERKGAFIEVTPLFCPEIRTTMINVLRNSGKRFFEGGVYACTEGPRRETSAEIKALSMLGADIVGMTVSPEVFLAKELEMCYACLCFVTDYAEGVTTIRTEKTMFKEAPRVIPPIIREVVLRLPKTRSCPCKESMKRVKELFDLPSDWHEWIK